MTEITVSEAIESYLNEKQAAVSDSTVQIHRHQSIQFRRWCGGADSTDNLDSIDPIDMSRFRRGRSADLNSNTVYDQLECVRPSPIHNAW